MTISPRELLQHMAVPDERGIYVLGCLERRVTFYAQQARALNLIYALTAENKISKGASIAVIGGGVSGLTAAAGAALRGYQVTLFEERERLLHLQWGCDKRWVHPHIYDWPVRGSLHDQADDLGVLIWRAAKASEVIEQLMQQWEQIITRSDIPQVQVHLKTRDVRINIRPNNKPEVHWNPGSKFLEFDAVILAVGFGIEKSLRPLAEHSYWRDDRLAQDDIGGPKQYLVSGTGDGGLTDLLRACIARFHHHEIVQTFNLDRSQNSAADKLAERLLAIEEQALSCESQQEAARLITQAYQAADMKALSAFVDKELRERLSSRRVILNGGSPYPLSLEASILNRYLASRLLSLEAADYVDKKLIDNDIESNPTGGYMVPLGSRLRFFNEVIIRHGTVSALEQGFPLIAAKCNRELKPRNLLDQTRVRLFPQGWFTDSTSSRLTYEQRSVIAPPSTSRVEGHVVPRDPPVINQVYFWVDWGADEWFAKLCSYGAIKLPKLAIPRRLDNIDETGYQFEYDTGDGSEHNRVWIIPSEGHVLARPAVERANNAIDYDGLASMTILSLGILAEDGKDSYLKLRKKKPIQIITNPELAGLMLDLLDEAARRLISGLDSTETSAFLAANQDGLYVVIEDARAAKWFYCINEGGEIIPETDELVRVLRNSFSALKHSSYGLPGAIKEASGLTPRQVSFDKAAYLGDCYREFNSVKYAALATTGLRLNKISLEELYVSTNAQTEDAHLSEVALNRAVDDALMGMHIDPLMRSQLKSQLKNLLHSTGTASGGPARDLYQRFGSILVLGDPGSGKTFFAKHEILAYCRPILTWYQQHLPVYIALAEAAQIIDWNKKGGEDNKPCVDFLSIASQLAARNGLNLPPEYLSERYEHGGIAFFFDGLDEVGSLDQRARMWEEIVRIADSVQMKGNRVLVTSRPAAVQIFDIPETIHSITLRGLTPAEMRQLAQRVLAARISEAGLSLDHMRLTDDDNSLVERLLSDCNNIQGIGRLAQNPLLFTLLIMIYANSGPPAAKRHRVYQQAVQTLVSVRSRIAGQKVFSEADLRKRLGAVALAVFRDPKGTIPSWEQTISCIQAIMSQEQGKAVNQETVEAFVTQVAESTGILVLHRNVSDNKESRITFMHHSFMEYYAAAGLHLEPNCVEEAARLVTLPKWREVILLFSGIIGDREGVTSFVDRLLQKPEQPLDNDPEQITHRALLIAIECALESEVPPEAAQRRLLEALQIDAERALICDGDLRRQVGEFLGRLYEASSGEIINDFLISQLRSTDIECRAAYIDIVGYVGEKGELRENLVEAFYEACDAAHAAITISACDAVARTNQLRGMPIVDDVLRRAFKGSFVTKYAAVRAVEKAPSLAKNVWPELVEALKQPKSFIALSAANAIVLAGWRVDPQERKERADLLQALRSLFRWGQEKHIAAIGQACSKAQVQAQLADNDEDSQLLGIYLMPWVRKSEEFLHDTLLEIIRDRQRTRTQVVAALDSLRLSEDAKKLVTMQEIDLICELLTTEFRDIKIAAARLLGAFIKRDNRVLDSLIAFIRKARRDEDEYRAGLRSLIQSPQKRVQHIIEEELVYYAKAQQRHATLHVNHFSEVLQASRELDWLASPRVIEVLKQTVSNWSLSEEIRGQALVTVGWLWTPEEAAVSYFCNQIRKRPKGLLSSLCESVAKFTSHCKRNMKFIRAVHGKLPELAAQLVRLGKALMDSHGGEQIKIDLQNLRAALVEIERINNIYNEFAGRKIILG